MKARLLFSLTSLFGSIITVHFKSRAREMRYLLRGDCQHVSDTIVEDTVSFGHTYSSAKIIFSFPGWRWDCHFRWHDYLELLSPLILRAEWDLMRYLLWGSLSDSIVVNTVGFRHTYCNRRVFHWPDYGTISSIVIESRTQSWIFLFGVEKIYLAETRNKITGLRRPGRMFRCCEQTANKTLKEEIYDDAAYGVTLLSSRELLSGGRFKTFQTHLSIYNPVIWIMF